MWQRSLLAIVFVLSGCHAGGRTAPTGSSAESDATPTRWAGTWVDHRRENYGGDLQCDARQVADDRWAARFYGNCGRDYSYQLDLVGTRDGEQIKFEGDVDLGEADGGVYTWIGYIQGDQFVGDYESAAGKAGSFAMTRLRRDGDR
jgi:hypothetical protein